MDEFCFKFLCVKPVNDKPDTDRKRRIQHTIHQLHRDVVKSQLREFVHFNDIPIDFPNDKHPENRKYQDKQRNQSQALPEAVPVEKTQGDAEIDDVEIHHIQQFSAEIIVINPAGIIFVRKDNWQFRND